MDVKSSQALDGFQYCAKGLRLKGDWGRVRKMRRGKAVAIGPSHSADGLFFLFDKGARPGRAALIDALGANPGISISHDPFRDDVPHVQSSSAANASRSGDWLEVLHWGMTFDCLGLAPGPAVAVPDVVQRLNLPVDLETGSLDALVLVPGPHLADAANSLPVVRSMLDIAATLTDTLDAVQAVCWSPAKSAIAPSFFSGAVRNWIDGGPFPALGLTGLSMSEAGTLETTGLNWFIGQELVLDHALSEDRVAATRLIVRLVHELVANGPVRDIAELQIDRDQRVLLQPMPGGRIEVTLM